MIECKVCISDYKDEIESWILKGESNNQIASYLKEYKQLDISSASINRHKHKHMESFKEQIKELSTPKYNSKYDRIENINIDYNAILESVKSLTENERYENIVKEYNTISMLIAKILKNQLLITVDLQQKYMQNECKYPYEQIKGLQVCQDILIKFESFQKDSFEYLKKNYEERKKSFEKIPIRTNYYQLGYDMKMKRPYLKGHIKMLIQEFGFDKALTYYQELYIPMVDNLNLKDENDFYKGVDSAKSEIELNEIKASKLYG